VFFALPEALEDQAQLVGGDAWTGVDHGEAHVLLDRFDQDVNASALLRELDGVADQVRQDLQDALVIILGQV
jgi:hypothetical protein